MPHPNYFINLRTPRKVRVKYILLLDPEKLKAIALTSELCDQCQWWSWGLNHVTFIKSIIIHMLCLFGSDRSSRRGTVVSVSMFIRLLRLFQESAQERVKEKE